MTPPVPPEDDLGLALRLGDLADGLTVRRFHALDLRVREKPDRTPVTDADTAVETAVRAELRSARPDDAFAGEETGGSVSSGRTWLVDPIDGTKNFLRGVPVWATLIALLEDGRPTVGVISAPALHSRWWAAADRGAWLRRGPAGTTPCAWGSPAAPASTRHTSPPPAPGPGTSSTHVRPICAWPKPAGRTVPSATSSSTAWSPREPSTSRPNRSSTPGTSPRYRFSWRRPHGLCTDLLGASPRNGTGALSANPRLHRLALKALSAPPAAPGPPGP